MERHFKINLLDYRLSVSYRGEVRFELLGGVTKQGVAHRNPGRDLFWDEPIYDDVDLGVDTFRVLNSVKKLLLEYVYQSKPWRFYFGASTDRKVPVYRWMAVRLDRLLSNYFLIEDPEGLFSFYRQQVSGESS